MWSSVKTIRKHLQMSAVLCNGTVVQHSLFYFNKLDMNTILSCVEYQNIHTETLAFLDSF
jgi:hypothetical protein